jgi:glutamate dehydrogenase
MIVKFNGKLGEGGFKVLIEESDITLPSGEIVKSGLDFRNGFHLWNGATADFFVPCGGRPQSVNIDNVHMLFKPDGKCRYKYIVEGANLFITEAARIYLQDRGIPLFKDASTNKGGVTSSSLEVLAGLSMDDETFAAKMCVRGDGSVPDFYQKYAAEICDIVETNAKKEFEYIWSQTFGNENNTVRATDITDSLSAAMNDLNDTVAVSDLFDRKDLRRKILRKHIPQCLQDEVGLDAIMSRVPDNYQRAIFSMVVASQFIYTYGDVDSPYYFYKFMDDLTKEAAEDMILALNNDMDHIFSSLFGKIIHKFIEVIRTVNITICINKL